MAVQQAKPKPLVRVAVSDGKAMPKVKKVRLHFFRLSAHRRRLAEAILHGGWQGGDAKLD